jgi:hypothetical protein
MACFRAILSLAIAAAALGGCAGSQDTGAMAAYGFAGAATTGATGVPLQISGANDEFPAGVRVVEFRARTGPDIIGHTYLVYGRQAADGGIAGATQVGLYPKEMSGFAVGVGGMAEATTEPVSFDKSIPATTVYRRRLSEDEYQRLSAAVAAARSEPPTWNWTKYNCNTFVADMAREIGLKTPFASTLMAPAVFVHGLKTLNSGNSGVVPDPGRRLRGTTGRQANAGRT